MLFGHIENEDYPERIAPIEWQLRDLDVSNDRIRHLASFLRDIYSFCNRFSFALRLREEMHDRLKINSNFTSAIVNSIPRIDMTDSNALNEKRNKLNYLSYEKNYFMNCINTSLENQVLSYYNFGESMKKFKSESRHYLKISDKEYLRRSWRIWENLGSNVAEIRNGLAHEGENAGFDNKNFSNDAFVSSRKLMKCSSISFQQLIDDRYYFTRKGNHCYLEVDAKARGKMFLSFECFCIGYGLQIDFSQF